MKKATMAEQVTHAATHPISSLAYFAGMVRGFAASVLRVAAGEQGPVIPGNLPGPVAAPLEEDLAPAEVVQLVHLDQPVRDESGREEAR